MKFNIVLACILVFITSINTRHAEKDYANRGRDNGNSQDIFDINETIRNMGDAIFLKNDKVCSDDIEIRVEEDWEYLAQCTVVEGDLVIATVNMRDSLKRWLFPSLKEITGKLIVYYTNLHRLDMFPNLVVIRGRSPLMGYSLVVMDTVLTHLHLPSLRLIQQGGVRVTKNHLMCHIRTIDWSLIINTSNVKSVDERDLVMVENNRGLCPDLCNQSLQCHKAIINEKRKELCWSPNVCQSVCDSQCNRQNLACWMNDTKRCCHEQCLGGCYGNGTELCVSCRHFVHNGTCVKQCPPGFYQYYNRRCITKEICFSKVVNDPIYYKRNISYSLFEDKCVSRCPPQYRRNSTTGRCVKCEPACPKRCGDAWVYGEKDLTHFEGCSSVRVLHISIRDGGEAEKLMEHLKKSFSALEEVEHYLKIINTGSLKTLSFLSNLRVIGYLNMNESVDDRSKPKGEQNVFEVVANDRLESLWTPSHALKKVKIYGRVHIHLNRQLCANKIFDFFDNHVQLMNGNLSEQERTFIQRANGDLMPCNVSTINLTIENVQARNVDIRWSPVDLTERDFFVTLLMIKATKKNISLVDDRASCQKSSWQIHEAKACVKREEEAGGLATYGTCRLTVPKLTPATRYAVYMESKTTQGDHGAVSEVVYFETATEPPTEPRDIELEALTWSSLRMSWHPPRHPNGKVTKYIIWYRPMKLVLNEFAGRNFCVSKIISQGAARRDPKRRVGYNSQSRSQFHNASVCTSCEQCLRKCGKNIQHYKTSQKTDVSPSFEDSLQNHIFVKRDHVTMWEQNGDDCFRWDMKVKSFLAECLTMMLNLKRRDTAGFPDFFEPIKRKPKKPSLTAAFANLDNKNVSLNSSSLPEPPKFDKFPSTETGLPFSPLTDTSSAMHDEDKDEESSKIPVPTTPTSPPVMTSPKIKPKVERRDHVWENRVEVEADITTFTFTNLKHFTEYIFAIRACQEAPVPEGEDGKMASTYSSDAMYDDDISSGQFNAKVCSKMSVANHGTLASYVADQVEDKTIEVNTEKGIRILWSRPKNPNGIIIHYWFRYRKRDPNEKRSNTNWSWRCIPLNEWYESYQELLNYRTSNGLETPNREKNDRSRRASSNSPPPPTEDDAAMKAERGGCLCQGAAYTPGVYEFSIKAVSIAGNGSWSNISTFEVEGDLRSEHDIIINIILPVLVVMILILFSLILSLLLFRKRRREANEVIFSNPEYQKIPAPDEWEIPHSDIVYYKERALGKGHFGVVVKGFVKNLQTPAADFYDKTDTVLAAIKTVRKEASFQEKLEFLSEANRMKTFHSFHVVQLLGVVSRMETREDRPQVIMEFMSHGDLASYLNQIKEKEAINMLSEAKILLWASQIADGMAYLSSNRVVHRDLAARNCLVDSQEVVKIADFGLTRELYYTEEAYKKRRNRGGVLGPFMWMAPESLARGNFSSLSDVWSYGVVLWEIATLGARPYPNMSAMAVKDYVLAGNNLLTRDDLWDNSWKKLCPHSVLDLMRLCFLFHDKDRPSFQDILFSLDPYIDERFIKCSFYLNQC